MLGVPYILKFEIVLYTELKYGHTDVRRTTSGTEWWDLGILAMTDWDKLHFHLA